MKPAGFAFCLSYDPPTKVKVTKRGINSRNQWYLLSWKVWKELVETLQVMSNTKFFAMQDGRLECLLDTTTDYIDLNVTHMDHNKITNKSTNKT